MPVSESDVKFRQVQKVPSNDTDPAGGTSTTDDITGASTAELLPRMSAQASGTLGTDIERQYQGADVHNLNATDDFIAPFFFLYGLIKVPAAAEKLRWVSDSASDGSSKKRRAWCKVGSAIVVEDTILNGTTQAVGSHNVAEVYLARTLLVSNDAPTTPTGAIALYSGNSGPGELISQLLAGDDWMSGQLDAGWVVTPSPTDEWDDRKTDPGVTYTRPWNLANAIAAPFDIEAETYGRIVFRQTLEPGMAGAPFADFQWEIGGDV